MNINYFILYSYNLRYDFSREDIIAITTDESMINKLYNEYSINPSKYAVGIRQIISDHTGKVMNNIIYKCNY